MEQDQQLIVKSNHIIETAYRLSLAEQRVILCAITKVRRDQPVTDEVLYSVTAAELAALCGTDMQGAYRSLKNAAERLQARRVALLLAPDGVIIRNKRKRITCWVQTVDYIEREGRIELRFGKDILPYLTDLKREFTRFPASIACKMNNAYAVRLYELLMQYPDGQREIAIDDLRRWLVLEDRYPSIRDFKRYVLDPAVSQINEHSPLAAAWSQRKTGAKVTHLLFNYTASTKPKKAPAKAQTKRNEAKPATERRPIDAAQRATGNAALDALRGRHRQATEENEA